MHRDYAKAVEAVEAVDSEMMNAELEAARERYLPQIGPRACAILNGGVSGGACHIPHEMAEAFWIIVKRRYNQKLKGTKTSRAHLCS